MRLWKSKTSRQNIITLAAVIIVFSAVFFMNQGGMLSSSLSGQLVPICVYIIMALSLNLTVGILGELSLGHAGFMSIGAFSGVLAVTSLGQAIGNPLLLMIAAILIGGVLAAIFGFLIGIPVLRLRGDYLAIVTLAFGEIIKNVLNCLYVTIDPDGLHAAMFSGAKLPGKFIINGPQGATVPEKLSNFGIGFVLVIIVMLIIMNFVHSKEGRAIKAIRDNPIAAESVGLNITSYKMKAFVISAAMAGMAGVLFAMNYSAIEAKKFNFNTSISVLVMVVLGGMGSLRGSIVAAIVLTILPELLRGFDDYRMLIYAIVLILVMILNSNQRFLQFKITLKKKITAMFRKKEAAKK
ncbi:MAG: branched-chain amino acid ABC transporter permease [Oscillospiraceae bacterium]|nr:branched-chain amino acid ABC transporter permease [Oscillospiraceae bacterium]